jgi:hypothetical protein
MILAFALAVAASSAVAQQEPPPRDLAALLRSQPGCAAVLERAHAHRLQVLLAEPFERADGSIALRRSRLGDPGQYFYPASSIKLCGAVALLQHLNEHNRAHGTALGLQSRVMIEPRFDGDRRIDVDPSNVDGGTLTVAHLLRKMILVSDNAAYNHCLEFVGQDGINRTMHGAGLTSARLWHRLSEARTLDENRVTRPVRCGDVVFAARDAGIELQNDLWHELDVGDARFENGTRVDGAMSFAQKNAIRVDDLQDLLVEVVRPEIDTGKRGFPGLTTEQRRFLVQALGELPRESANPRYDPERTPDHACKFVLRGVRRVVPAEHLRVCDKIGRAYGFSIENAWIEDLRTGQGFFLTIVLYTNADGVLNDDRYDYEGVADPFLDDAAEAIARVVFAR